jgi:hypothetical protein
MTSQLQLQLQLRLPPIKARIFALVKRRPGASARELCDWAWRDAIDGGPLTDTKCLHVHIAQLNRLLAVHGICVRSEGGGYRIRSVTP